MAIKIKSLEVDDLTKKSLDKDFLYKDLSLDIENDVFLNKRLNKKESLKDVAAIYDIEAVKNSIRTAMLTSPGENILVPTYGIDLRRYIFEPVSDFTTEIIRKDITRQLPFFEPRVEVVNVTVIGDPENNQYNIVLQINVPSLGITGLSLKSELNSSGYTIL